MVKLLWNPKQVYSCDCIVFFSQLSHPNLVQLYGVVTQSKPLIIVTELMHYGKYVYGLVSVWFSKFMD